MWTGTAIASSSRPSGYCGCCTDFPATKKQKKELKLFQQLRLIETFVDFTLGGIASICFKFHFQTDYQQTLRMQIQESQGCQKIRKIVRNLKLPIARSTIHPSLSKIKNHYWKTIKNWEKESLINYWWIFYHQKMCFNLKMEVFRHFF